MVKSRNKLREPCPIKRRVLEHFGGLDVLGGARAVRLLTSTCRMLVVATQEGMTSGLAALSPRQPAAPIPHPPHTQLGRKASPKRRASWVSHLTLSPSFFFIVSHICFSCLWGFLAKSNLRAAGVQLLISGRREHWGPPRGASPRPRDRPAGQAAVNPDAAESLPPLLAGAPGEPWCFCSHSQWPQGSKFMTTGSYLATSYVSTLAFRSQYSALSVLLWEYNFHT